MVKSSRCGIIAIAILAALAVALALFSPKLFDERDVKARAENAGINPGLIAAKGTVESEEEIEVSNLALGTISEVRVDEGDRVEKGQTLLLLDSCKVETRLSLSEAMLGEARARLNELEAGYQDEDIEMAESRVARLEVIHARAKNEHERQKRLYHREATTLVEYEKAEDKVKVAAADLNEAKANLKKLEKGIRAEEIEQARSAVERATAEVNYYRILLKDYTITSPIHGLVAETYRDAGEVVDVGTPLMKLINPDKLRIRAELEETDVGRVEEGQPLEVLTDAYEGRIYRGKVDKVFPVLKRYTLRAFDPSAVYDINAQYIYAELDDFSGLKSGMQVTVRFLK
jgi:multidrug resistance efflux pump